MIKNAITVERKDICPKIAGLKEEEGKGKGQRGEKEKGESG